MTGKTHIVAGLWCGLGAAILTQSPAPQALLFMAVAGLTATLPDIDHPRAHLRQRLGFLGHALLGWLRHRGPTHSLIALVLVGITALHFWPLYALPALLGYGSHIVTDMMTPRGLAVLWPLFGRSFWLLPKILRITTGGGFERLLRIALLLTLVWQMHQHGLFAAVVAQGSLVLTTMEPLICRGSIESTCAAVLGGR